MQSVKSWVIGAALAVMLALSAACSPTAPTPPPPPPPPPAPLLSCGDGVSRATVNAGGLAVDFDAPSATGGQAPVNVVLAGLG